MAIEFKREVLQSKFLDPLRNFNETVYSFEVRSDPLTQKPSLIYKLRRLTLPKKDLSSIIQKSLNTACPFCPQAINTVTPKFISQLLPEGRIRFGEACIFPNAMPYAPYSAILVLSSQHFVALSDFTREMLTNGLISSQTYLKRVREYDTEVKYICLGWNYMPPSGSSQLHPHLQIEATYSPTPYHKDLLEASHQFYIANGTNFWSELVIKEQQLGERYIGNTGNICWLTWFAPRGKMFDILAIFQNQDSYLSISDQDFTDFAIGLEKVFRYLSDHNYYSFNMSINSGVTGDSYFWTQVRIIPRLTFFELEISDYNYNDVLQDVHFSGIYPEDICQELKKYFEG
jgi:galactose-1-phosphate uridylyltransferase